VTALHQFLPTFAGRDAIGQHCLRLQRLLREAGFESEIFTMDAHDDVVHRAHTIDRFSPAPDTWALYQFSIGSPMVDALVAFGVPLALDYHNVTDARYFLRWEPRAASTMFEGRRQLATMPAYTRFALAVSSFNEAELIELGFSPTAVAPVLIDFADYDAEPDAALLRRRRERRDEGGTDWLFVGRIAPNKCQHDVIAAFAAYRALHDPDARLTLVGGQTAIRYWHALHKMCREIGIADAVTFTDVVTHAQLLACYRTADVFVCCSEHEGFNVPVLEAMHFDVPVVAYAAAALPETLGDGGLLLTDKDPAVVACAVHEVLTNEPLRKELVTAGRGRVERFSLTHTGPETIDIIKKMLA
jgi:glycosyltransferase involved in cell wall biosynthesis